MSGSRPSRIRRSIRRHLLVGGAAVALLVGGVGGWAATTQIAGAVIASGRLVVETAVKKVQHPIGGVVSEILVRDDQEVDGGDIVVRLDETQARSRLAILEGTLDELAARQARLEAERDGLTTVRFPDDLLARSDADSVAELTRGEETLFQIRKTARQGRKAQLREQISQLREEVAGIEAQQQAKIQEIDWTSKELKGVQELWERSLVQFARLTELERAAARLAGERGSLVAAAAQTKRRISEIEMQIAQVDQDLASEVASQLSDIRARRSELLERRIAVNDELMRMEIRAPYSGRVHELAVHTVGGVIQPGEPIMLIVPESDLLVVEVQVRPDDIDQLSAGQDVALHFTSFSRRSTPGAVRNGGADLTRRDAR